MFRERHAIIVSEVLEQRINKNYLMSFLSSEFNTENTEVSYLNKLL